MKILFCDWNGTLLDDMPLFNQARRKTFLAFGVKPPSLADYFRELESGDYLDTYRKHGITASRDQLNAVYQLAYEEQLLAARLFPEVKETLQQLRQDNFRLVLVTTQLESLVIPLLDKFGIGHLFNDRVFHALDKRRAILEIAQQNNTAPDKCFFVGDSPSDIRQAKKAGVVAIAFLGNYIPVELLADADYFIHSFKAILNLV